MKKVSIFASIWAQNLGDELILKNEIELLRQEFWEDTQFQVASYDIHNPVFQIQNTSYFEYFPIGIKNPKNILRNMRNLSIFLKVILWSDIVVIWWGGIIYDSELQSVKNPLNQWIFRSKVARFFWKKLYFFALWIDIKDPENSLKLQTIFKKSWKITVRDEKSQKQLQKIWIQSDIVDDPVMQERSNISGNNEEKIIKVLSSNNFRLRDFESVDFSRKKVWLALRQGYIGKSKNRELEKHLIEELLKYIESQGGKIVLLPHSLHSSDIIANDYAFMKQFLTNDREIYASLGEVYTAYTHKMIDILISMRLHSIILGYCYEIPQVVLSYSQKTDEVLKKLS